MDEDVPKTREALETGDDVGREAFVAGEVPDRLAVRLEPVAASRRELTGDVDLRPLVPRGAGYGIRRTRTGSRVAAATAGPTDAAVRQSPARIPTAIGKAGSGRRPRREPR